MVKTYGLTHVNLAVRDGERALEFYGQVFGLEACSRAGGLIHCTIPGTHDVMTFDPNGPTPGVAGGIAHFGFRLTDAGDIDDAVTQVERAGGKLLRRGEFRPGFPYAYVADPDGYEVEIWFE